MKKYFSLIAVAMFAVSSVFTSCSKDDAGSSYNPEVQETRTNTLNGQKVDQNMTQANVQVTVVMNDGAMPSAEANQMAVGKMEQVLRSKLGTAASVKSSASTRGGMMQIEFKPELKSVVMAAMNSITSEDIAAAMSDSYQVKSVILSSSCSDIATAQWTR